MPRQPIYLDNHATTRVDDRVLEAMLPYFTEHFGNAASKSHRYGWAADSAVGLARERIAQLLGARPEHVVFTSGATESNNLAIKGVAERAAGKRRHLVTTAIEHSSVLDSCAHLERAGFELTVVQPSSEGIIEPEAVEGALRDDTLLVSVMLVNNEVGTVQPIEDIARRARSRGAFVHVDASQGIGRVPFDAGTVDAVSLTAHKIYGPKGVGALWVNPAAPLTPVAQLDGGGHERGLRSGTLNVPGIVGLGRAAELYVEEGRAEAERVGALRDRLRSGLLARIDDVLVNGSLERRVCGNLNLSIRGVSSGTLLARLRRIAVSSGSACSSASTEPSHVLTAMGLPRELATTSLRFGVGRFNTEADIDAAIEHVAETVAMLRGAVAAPEVERATP